MSARRLSITGILIVLVGAFMVLNGIDAVTGSTRGFADMEIDIGKLFQGSGKAVNTVFAWVEIAAGVILIISRFNRSFGNLDRLLRVIILIFWVILMIFGLFAGGAINSITTLAWWSSLVNGCIILCILWIIRD